MKRNIYELAADFSPEADAMIEKWSSFGTYNCGIKRDARTKLEIMIHTIEGEDIVKDYLNSKNEGRWHFTDPERLLINDAYAPKNYPDLYDSVNHITCEIKEVNDRQWTAVGKTVFKLKCEKDNILSAVFHNADNCIVINSSHNKLAQIDLNSIKKLGNGYFTVEALKVISIEE